MSIHTRDVAITIDQSKSHDEGRGSERTKQGNIEERRGSERESQKRTGDDNGAEDRWCDLRRAEDEKLGCEMPKSDEVREERQVVHAIRLVYFHSNSIERVSYVVRRCRAR